MKTVLKTLSTLALLSTTAFAGDGFYLGAGVGMHASDNKVKLLDSTQTDRFSTRDKSVLGQIAIGHDCVFMKHFLVGLEGEGRFGPNDSENFSFQNGDRFGKIKHTYALGLAARLGLKVEALKVYLRIGGEYGRLKFEYTNSNDPTLNMHGHKKLLGVTPGLGLSHDINQHWTVGVEGRTTFFKKKNYKGHNATVNNSAATIKHRNDTFLFNIRYFFN